MKLCWVTLSVRNMEKSLEFYGGLLGLPVAVRHPGGPGVEIAMLGEADRPKVELLCSRDGKPGGGAGVSVGFAVESLDRALEFVKNRRVPVVRGPFSPNPSVKFFFIHDPDGYEVQIVESHA